MAFSFLTEDNIFDLCQQAKDHTERLTQPFAEYSRIARNKPSDKVPAKFPKITDGTASAIIRKSPRRTIQQLPTGVVESDTKDSPWPIIADFKYRTRIIPLANTDYDLIQKCWSVAEDGKTFGAKAVHTPLLNKDGELLPDYVPLYWGDVFVQPGKKSGNDCDYIFMRSWWQRGDVEALIDAEKSRRAQARKDGSVYVSVWDVRVLEEIKEATTPKDEMAQTPSEDKLALDPSGIEIITGYQRGVDAEFFIFNPATNKIVGRKKNIDPRGTMPIDWYYYDTDGSNPLGRSILELIGPIQNQIDSDMQANGYNRARSMQSPVNVFGNINPRRLSFAPNALNHIQDPNVRIEAMQTDTVGMQQYADHYSLHKTQLLALANSNADTSTSAEVGNPGFGKTPTAIKAQQASMSVDDNAERKSFEAHFENWSETAINLYFGARNSKEEMRLDEETANKLRELERKVGPQDGYEWVRGDSTLIIVDFSKAKEALHFRVDASTSKVNNEAAQLEALQVLVTTLDSSQSLSAVVPLKQKLAVWNAIVANTAVENAEELKVSDEELETMQQEQQMMTEGVEVAHAGNEDAGAAQAMEQEAVDTPEPTSPADEMILRLRAQGVSEELLAEVPSMVEKGYSEEEILHAIQGVTKQEEEYGQ